MKNRPLRTVDAKYYGIKFKDLIQKYPKLQKFLVHENPPKFDLGNPEVLSELNRCLFKELAGLDITVPEGYLIPAYSLRMAYAEVVNSLLNSDLPIIEIGTGASAAISLLLAKKFHRKVIATEINEVSFESAKKNIFGNGMEEYITLLKSEGQIIKDFIPKGNYSAILCYPPIYHDDKTKLEKIRGWKGVRSELIGGKRDGLEFTHKLIQEALESEQILINIITIQVLNKEQVESIFHKFGSNYNKCEYVEIKAGTRKRYIPILYKN
ncbi:MAG: RlmF-related methyltransferase [Candidatus Heimdallarchaeaceae archaeon]